ncbi:hypothetical protein CFF27374_07410 [Campylobacter fetus subsp. fetus]|nr:hypothetical protein CFF27374_07410 [Campylobacter fetus subsp. fetus]
MTIYLILSIYFSKTTNRNKSFYIKEALKDYLATFDNRKYELNNDTLKSINNIEKVCKFI